MVVVVTQGVRYFAQADEAKFTKYKQLYADSKDVDTVIDAYQESMNELFNGRIKVMVKELLPAGNEEKKLSEDDVAKIFKLLAPPAIKYDKNGLPVGREECKGVSGKPPLSTYCLAQDAVKEYFLFREGILYAKKEEKDKITTMSAALIYQATLEKINRELEVSRDALDKGLAAYSELQMALPMHKKYMEVVDALIKYGKAVGEIRKSIDLFPNTFINVSTTACT